MCTCFVFLWHPRCPSCVPRAVRLKSTLWKGLTFRVSKPFSKYEPHFSLSPVEAKNLLHQSMNSSS